MFKPKIENPCRHTLPAALALLLLIGCQISANESRTGYGYVVAEDKRIYMVDLATGELEWISRTLDRVGDISETEIEINREHSILYIGSGAFIPRDYDGLIAVRLNDTADLVFSTPSYGGAWNVRLHPDGKSLYVSFGSHFAENDWRETIVNPMTGEIIGGLNINITKQSVFSPDGRLVSRIFPEWSRATDSGTVGSPDQYQVADLYADEVLSLISLEEGFAQYPPWETTDDHFIFVRRQRESGHLDIEVYDRESGKQLTAYNTLEAFGLAGPRQLHVTRIPGSENVAMTIGGSLVVFNPLTAELVSRTFIHGGFITEVVVTDKPLIRTAN